MCRPRHQPDGKIAGASTRARQNGLRDGLHQVAQLQPGRRATGTRGVASSQKRSRSRCRSDSYHCGKQGLHERALRRWHRRTCTLEPCADTQLATKTCNCREVAGTLPVRTRSGNGQPDRETGRAPEARHGFDCSYFSALSCRRCQAVRRNRAAARVVEPADGVGASDATEAHLLGRAMVNAAA